MRISWPTAAMVFTGAIGSVGGLSCKTLECGTGTIEQDGKCVASVDPPGKSCGPGTFYDPTSGVCRNSLFEDGGGICGANTTQVIDDAGNRVCVGTGGSGNDCASPPPCPMPTDSSKISLCGRLYDLADSSPIDDGDPDDGEPSKDIGALVIEPLSFVRDPASPTILATGTLDACGRFQFPDVPWQATNLIAVAFDDLDSNGDGTPDVADTYVLSGIAAPAAKGATLSGMRGFILRHDTDEAWSTAAGLPAGSTFGSLGVYVPIYVNPQEPGLAPFPGTPVAGVTVTVLDGLTSTQVPHPENDFYFDDSDPLSRTMLSATRSSTGMNGTGLYINQAGLGTMSGAGSEPTGCNWPADPGAAPTGAVFVNERIPTARDCSQ